MDLEKAPADPIQHLAAECRADPRTPKYDLVIGTYCGDTGRAVVFGAVKEAVSILVNDAFRTDYLPMTGDAEFCELSQELLFGEADDRLATVQTLSGTGALYVAASLLKMLVPFNTVVYYSNPTWPNHLNIFGYEQAGFQLAPYRYWSRSGGVFWEGMQEDLQRMGKRSILIVQACAHNPTGHDLSKDQWEWVLQLTKEKRLYLVIDVAYQGFASGNLEQDVYVVRRARELGVRNAIVCQSYSKNMGLYGHRVGACHMVCENAEDAKIVKSWMEQIVRRTYSSPPRMGSDIVRTILKSAKLSREWKAELESVSKELAGVRQKMRCALEAYTTDSWKHLTDQIGMFAYTGLTEGEIQTLRAKHAVFITDDGRMSLASLPLAKVDEVCLAIADVLNAHGEPSTSGASS